MYLDSDSSVWYDHDEKTWGDPDTDFNREEYPEGFLWDCCEKRGDAKGCTSARHEVVSGKRRKYARSPDASSSDHESEEGEGESEDDEGEDEE